MIQAASEERKCDNDESTWKTILHYSQISLAIQKTKSPKDKDSIREGKASLEQLLEAVKETWGTHPIAMEVEKSLADVHLKEGTDVAYGLAEKHYDAAHDMMKELNITQVEGI